MKFDRGKVKEEDFIKFLEMLGLPVTLHVLKVLKKKKEVGTCSFTELIKALRLPPETKM